LGLRENGWLIHISNFMNYNTHEPAALVVDECVEKDVEGVDGAPI
jgi:hypothetical protein